MKLERFMACMERIAPRELAWERDNVGLLIGTRKEELGKVLVALECTNAVAREAAEWGADLVLAHHPLFFHPVQRLLPGDPETAAAFTLIENGIGLFCAHTNLDAADGGVNDALCGRLELSDVRGTEQDPILRLATVSPPLAFHEFAARCETLLGAQAQVCGEPDTVIRTVAVVGGAGGEYVAQAHALGADVLITGEAKHHEALAACELGVSLLALGHYQTEVVVLASLISRLQPEDFDVQYKISRTGRAPFRASGRRMS